MTVFFIVLILSFRIHGRICRCGCTGSGHIGSPAACLRLRRPRRCRHRDIKFRRCGSRRSHGLLRCRSLCRRNSLFGCRCRFGRRSLSGRFRTALGLCRSQLCRTQIQFSALRMNLLQPLHKLRIQVLLCNFSSLNYKLRILVRRKLCIFSRFVKGRLPALQAYGYLSVINQYFNAAFGIGPALAHLKNGAADRHGCAGRHNIIRRAV